MRFSKTVVSHTREVFEPRLGRKISDSEAEAMISGLSGFYSFLLKWDKQLQEQDQQEDSACA